MVDHLIIGQGVAGSFLAWNLIKQKKSILIIDADHQKSSSIVSAGIMNPITGKRFALTPDYDMYYTHALKTYKGLEDFFGDKFFESKPILRIFKNIDEKKHWDRKNELGIAQEYCDEIHQAGAFGNLFDDPLGSITIKHGGFCNTVKLLKAFQNYFDQQNVLIKRRIKYDDIKITDSEVRYDNKCFKNIIFCEGYQSQYNPWFQWLPFNSVKGEILRLKMNEAALPDAVINKGKWCVPAENKNWMSGATYIWDDLNCEPTEQGKAEILSDLDQWIACRKEVLDHQAAVRPVMQDQKPAIGMHPQIKRMGIFNGLGSKGFLMAPYYAEHFVNYLLQDSPLNPDVNVNRFTS